MHPKKILFVFFASLVSTSAFSNSTHSCSDQKDEVQYTLCLKKLRHQSETQLQVADQHFQNKIQSWDEDADYKKAALTAFLKSVDSFHQFLTDECVFESSMAAGGNGKEAISSQCHIELINRRIDYLKAHEYLIH